MLRKRTMMLKVACGCQLVQLVMLPSLSWWYAFEKRHSNGHLKFCNLTKSVQIFLFYLDQEENKKLVLGLKLWFPEAVNAFKIYILYGFITAFFFKWAHPHCDFKEKFKYTIMVKCPRGLCNSRSNQTTSNFVLNHACLITNLCFYSSETWAIFFYKSYF